MEGKADLSTMGDNGRRKILEQGEESLGKSGSRGDGVLLRGLHGDMRGVPGGS